MLKVDPITLQVVGRSLSGIVQEMQLLLRRTGYSTIIRESNDFCCAILDREGGVIGQYSGLNWHFGSFPPSIEGILRIYSVAEIEEGDAFVLNHPYYCGSPHSMDWTVVTPVFYRDELVAFCASIAHKSDIGGANPGSRTADAREIFAEGLQLPPVKYESRYKRVKETENIIKANTRTPELVIGDVDGQVGTGRVGGERLKALMDKYGKDTVLSSFEQLYEATERRVRLEIAQWKDGAQEAEGFLDHDLVDVDKPVRLHVRIVKQKDTILFDFSESAEQGKGPKNVRPPLVKGICYYSMLSMIDPTLLYNKGLARVVETRFREGTILNPRFPAALNYYSAILPLVDDLVLSALSKLAGRPPIAGSGGSGLLTIGQVSTETRKGDRPYVHYEILPGGVGAFDGGDGWTGTPMHGSAGLKFASIEILEAEFPVRLNQFRLIPGSGGAGKFRGGPGYVRDYVILRDSRLSGGGDRRVIAPWGAEGGEKGTTGAFVINPDTPSERVLRTYISNVALKPGDVLRVVTGGGGGVGNPRERERARVMTDLEDGYITSQQAKEIYGLGGQRERAKSHRVARLSLRPR